MALVLTFKTEPNSLSDRMWITDKTGEYDLTSNPEGWGPSNHTLANSALVAIIVRKDSDGDQRLAPVSAAVYHNNAAIDTDETVFEFYYVNDGVHNMYLFRLPVSADGVTDLEANSLSEGDYFFHNSLNDVYQRVGSENVLVTDYSVLIDVVQNNLYQTLCEDHFSGLRSVHRQQKYREYQEARTGSCAEDPKFAELWGITEDIISSEFAFRSGLQVEAQNMTETQLDERDIDNVNSPA